MGTDSKADEQVKYVGVRGPGRVPTVRVETIYFTNGEERGRRTELLPHVVHHSPDGFEWGYEGSGPADLALSLANDTVLHCFPVMTSDDRRVRITSGNQGVWIDSRVWNVHQDLKREIVAYLKKEGWKIPRELVIGYINGRIGVLPLPEYRPVVMPGSPDWTKALSHARIARDPDVPSDADDILEELDR